MPLIPENSNTVGVPLTAHSGTTGVPSVTATYSVSPPGNYWITCYPFDMDKLVQAINRLADLVETLHPAKKPRVQAARKKRCG